MRHKKKVLAAALILTMAGTAGCGVFTKTSAPIDPPPSDKNQAADLKTNTMSATIYYADDKGFVVPLRVSIPKADAPASQALAYMTPEKSASLLNQTDLHSVLPAGTKASVDLKGDTATVNFSKEVLDIKVPKTEQQMVDAVVWTLTEFPNIKKVQFKVNGEIRPTLTGNTPIGQPVGRANGINLQVSEKINPSETSKVTVYYQGSNKAGNFNYLVPVTRLIPKTNDDIVKTTIAELSAGPMTAALHPTIATATKLLDAKVSGDTVNLDFENIMMEGASTQQQNILNSIVLSVLENTTAQKVKITVKGQTPTAGPGIDLSKPMVKPLIINQKTAL